MVTGLLFTLAQRRIGTEGRSFPNQALASKPTTLSVVPKNGGGETMLKITKATGVILGLTGLALFAIGGVEWSFDPALGLKIQTAVISFTLPTGVFL